MALVSARAELAQLDVTDDDKEGGDDSEGDVDSQNTKSQRKHKTKIKYHTYHLSIGLLRIQSSLCFGDVLGRVLGDVLDRGQRRCCPQ